MSAEPAEKAPGSVAAQEELGILDRLSRAVWTKISELAKRPSLGGNLTHTELSLREQRYSTLKGFEELADQSYGRTVAGQEIEEDGRPRAPFKFRITQANVGYVEDGCFVLARNLPLASVLVTAQPSDEPEARAGNRMRYFKVDEVRTFDGPTSLRSPTEEADFRLMALRRASLRRPILVENPRTFVRALTAPQTPAPDRLPEVPIAPTPRPEAALDPTWLEDWAGIYLPNTETVSLGHQFFTRTTPDQESALNTPRGVTFVEGIAGAGKTSVALGRLKFFANFATGENREHYGLQASAEKDFSPVGMVGFVLSHSLKRYLKETAASLGLERLPIRDFQEYRTHLLNQFGLTRKFKRNRIAGSVYRTRLLWLRAVDSAMARVAGRKLRELLLSAQGVHQAVQDVVSKRADDLIHAELGSYDSRFHMSSLAQRLATDVSQMEFRVHESALRERMRRETLGKRFDLERELDQLRLKEERRIMSPLVRRLIGAVAAHELFSPAIMLEGFSLLVRNAFGVSADDELTNDLIAELRALLASEENDGKVALADSDLVTLISMAAMIADGFDFPDAHDHLYQVRRSTGVFIDEVQDFTELEVLLMGMNALDTYHQITLSGDRCQRLLRNGAVSYADLFPSVPRARHNQSVFLSHNFRQREELAALSLRFRGIVQGDSNVRDYLDEHMSAARVYSFESRSTMAALILQRLRSIPAYATTALIVPSEAEARDWYNLLEDDLASVHRPALLSRREDLTRRFDIHFAEVYETKGLEFDVVVLPDLSAFALDDDIGRNQAYVAISRAKHALLLGCQSEALSRPSLSNLIERNLLRSAEIRQDLLH